MHKDYKYIQYLGHKQHMIKDLNTGDTELWVSNKGHASYGIKYKNTDLEFVRILFRTPTFN